MSYNPTNWQNGVTPLSAQNMNKIEQGIVSNEQSIRTTNINLQTTNNNVAALNAKIPKMIIINEEDE